MAVETFQFVPLNSGALELHGTLLSWNDSVRIRLAGHEFLKKDGALQEPMGAAAGRFSFKCVLLGEEVSAKYQNIVQVIRRQPRGQLTHPRLGRIDVACEGVEANEDPAQAMDCIDFSISFVEDSTQTVITVSSEPRPADHSAKIEEASENLGAEVASLASLVVSSAYTAMNLALGVYTRLSSAFGVQALEAAQSTGFDPALQTMRDRVQIKMNTFIETVRDTGLSDAQLFPVLMNARQVYAAVVNLYNAVIALKPPIIIYTLPTAMTLATVLVTLYGKDARAKRDEVLLLNPYILTHYWIPQGTKMRVTAPESRQ